MIDKFSILNGLKYLYSGILENYFVSISAKKNFSDTTRIDSWKSIGMSEENIKTKIKSVSNFAQTVTDYHVLLDKILKDTV